MKRILHTGSKFIDFSKEINVTDTMLNKPDSISGCLWGSTLIKLPGNKVGSSWKYYTSGAEYLSKDYKYGVSFTLNRKSKILEINNLNDYKSAMKRYGCKIHDYDLRYCLDFAKISKEYDAFHLTEDAFWRLRMPIDKEFNDLNYEDFYCYDAESWIIFNLNAINKGSILSHNNVTGYEDYEEDEDYDY